MTVCAHVMSGSRHSFMYVCLIIEEIATLGHMLAGFLSFFDLQGLPLLYLLQGVNVFLFHVVALNASQLLTGGERIDFLWGQSLHFISELIISLQLIYLSRRRQSSNKPSSFHQRCNQMNGGRIIRTNMKQIITLNFGQAGINISDQTLSLYLREHNIANQQTDRLSPLQQPPIDVKCNRVLFDESSKGTLSYRAISVDCDPYSTNQLLTGVNKNHYSQSRMVNSKDGTGGLYSRGHAISTKQLSSQLVQSLQKALQCCDNLQGIMVNVALLGGASGIFHHSLATIVGEEYLRKKVVISNLLFPSEQYSNSIVEIYNYVLAFRALLEFSSLNIPFDNQSLYTMCEKAGIDYPGYNEINQIIAGVQSSLTLPFRSNGPLNSNLNELTTNLVCYPRINLTYPSCTPFLTSERIYDRLLLSAHQLTTGIFDPANRLIKMHGVASKIAVGLYYEGEVSQYEVFQSIQSLRDSGSSNFRFEPWSPLGLKVGINPRRPLPHYFLGNSLHPRTNGTVTALTSSMEFNHLLAFNNYKFDRLHANRAYVYTYIQQGMEEREFMEAREDLAALEKDYQYGNGVQFYMEE